MQVISVIMDQIEDSNIPVFTFPIQWKVVQPLIGDSIDEDRTKEERSSTRELRIGEESQIERGELNWRRELSGERRASISFSNFLYSKRETSRRTPNADEEERRDEKRGERYRFE